MAIKKSLTFDIYGKDKSASKTIKKVGDSADDVGRRLGKVGGAIAAGVAVAAGAAIAFGIDAVKAFADAEESQNKLKFALDKFPKTADTNIQALGKLNDALMKKTRFDDDAIAVGQSVLAQYDLTGEQLERLTPLMLDYAAKTGKDLTTASEDLGKALFGQGRSLKEVGIDFTDTGTLAGNFDAIVEGLRGQVGGFAESEAETAAGKLDQLRNRFGEVQEKIGAALMPELERLMEWIEGEGGAALDGLVGWIVDEAIPNVSDFIGWVVRWKDELALVAGAIGAATFAQWLLNAAMAVNPVGAVVTALILASAWIIHVMNNFEDFRVGVLNAADGVLLGMVGITRGFNGFVEDLVNNMISGINSVIDAVNGVLSAIGMAKIGRIGYFNMDNSGLDRLASNLKRNLGSGTSGGGGAGGRRMMATGGIVKPTAGGTNATIGEAGTAEAVIPLSRSALAKYGLGGGDTYVVNVSGVTTHSEAEMGRVFVKAVKAAQDSGLIRKVLPVA